MIDINARNKLQTAQTQKALYEGIDKIATAIKESSLIVPKPQIKTPANDVADELRSLQRMIGGGNLTESLLKLSKSLDGFDVNENALGQLKGLVADLSTKLRLLSEIEVKLPKEIKMNFPKEFPVTGTVDVGMIESLPPVKVSNLDEVGKAVGMLINNLQFATIKAIQASKTSFPTSMNVSNEVKIAEFSELLDGIEELKKGFNILINKDKDGNPVPQDVNILNFPPTMVPQPVTNVSINPSRGETKATAITVTTTLTPLPPTALFDRRSMTLYNNGSVTIYVGGANVTSATGVPVGAGLWGPSLDVGPKNIVYAVTASGSSDIRVLEMSDTMEGGDS